MARETPEQIANRIVHDWDMRNGLPELRREVAYAIERDRDCPSEFLGCVALELNRARRTHPTPIHSAHEGYAVILEELDEFKTEVWKNQSRRDKVAMCAELIQIAAMCARVAEDIGLMEAWNADD